MNESLIGVGMDFAAFLMFDKELQKVVKMIVLFGSVASGDADEESDIDLFIEAPEKSADAVRERYKLWTLSTRAEFWRAQGIQQEISIHIGELKKWKHVHRFAISNGLVLYSKYISIPDKLRQFALVTIQVPAPKKSSAVQVWRKLYGYTQKTKKKTYTKKGLVELLSVIRVNSGVLLVPADKLKELIVFFKENKISYGIRDMWIG